MKKIILFILLLVGQLVSAQTFNNNVTFTGKASVRDTSFLIIGNGDTVRVFIANDSVRFVCLTCTGYSFTPALPTPTSATYGTFQVVYTNGPGNVVVDGDQKFSYNIGSDTTLYVQNRIGVGTGSLGGQWTNGVGISNLALMVKGYLRYRNGQQAASTYLAGDAFGDITYHKYDTLTLGYGLTGTRKIMGTTNTAKVDTATIATQYYVADGLYTPTLFNVTNVSASTAYECQWSKTDSTITISGQLDIDATETGATEIGISLPFASNFTATNQCAGTAASDAAAALSARVLADDTNDRATVKFTATSLTNDSYSFQFTYKIR